MALSLEPPCSQHTGAYFLYAGVTYLEGLIAEHQQGTSSQQHYGLQHIEINLPAPEKPQTQPLIRDDGNQACDQQHRQGVHADSGDRDPE